MSGNTATAHCAFIFDNDFITQGSHRSGNSGKSRKVLKTFSSQGNLGKTGFSAKIKEKNFKSGNFFSKLFLNLLNL